MIQLRAWRRSSLSAPFASHDVMLPTTMPMHTSGFRSHLFCLKRYSLPWNSSAVPHSEEPEGGYNQALRCKCQTLMQLSNSIELKSYCQKIGGCFVKMSECWSQIDWWIQQVSDCEMIQQCSNASCLVSISYRQKSTCIYTYSSIYTYTYIPWYSNLTVPLQWIAIIQILESGCSTSRMFKL